MVLRCKSNWRARMCCSVTVDMAMQISCPLSSRRSRLFLECPRCAGFHHGSDNDCAQCAICSGWHAGDDCEDAFVKKLCRRCGVQHLEMFSCPCPRCHYWHGIADCDSIRSARAVRPDVMIFELEDRRLPCSDCNVWHSPSESCDNWSMHRRVRSNSLHPRSFHPPME